MTVVERRAVRCEMCGNATGEFVEANHLQFQHGLCQQCEALPNANGETRQEPAEGNPAERERQIACIACGSHDFVMRETATRWAAADLGDTMLYFGELESDDVPGEVSCASCSEPYHGEWTYM